MRVHYLQQEPFEGPGSIEPWAKEKGHALSVTKFYQDAPTPPFDEIDLLIILGGSMNIYEEESHPWLAREKRFIRQAIESGKAALGICLGAQLIADVMGGKVTRNAHKEIGWFPIELTPEARNFRLFNTLPQRLPVFHWHGDTFSLPPGAVHIARSEACENQAFIFRDRVVALQFHAEFMRPSLEAITAGCAKELVPGKYIQTPAEMFRPEEEFGAMNAVMSRLLDGMTEEIKS